MANKTMHHAVIGADTFELIDEKGREEITALKEDLSESVDDLKSALNYSVITLTRGGWINTNGDTTDYTINQSNNYYYAIVDCAGRDMFAVMGVGTLSARLWAFVDTDGNILKRSDANKNAAVNPDYAVAPEGTVKIVINSSTNKISVKSFQMEAYKIQLGDILAETQAQGNKRFVAIDQVIGKLTQCSYTVQNGFYTSAYPNDPPQTAASGYNCLRMAVKPGEKYYVTAKVQANTKLALALFYDKNGVYKSGYKFYNGTVITYVDEFVEIPDGIYEMTVSSETVTPVVKKYVLPNDNVWEELGANAVVCAVQNNEVKIAYKYSGTKDGIITFKPCGANDLVQFYSFYLRDNDNMHLIPSVTGGTNFLTAVSDWVGPYGNVEVVNNADGDISGLMFTGGWHGSDGNTGVPTATPESVKVFIDDYQIQDSNVYTGTKVKIIETNLIQASNTVKQNGTGRGVIRETITYEINGYGEISVDVKSKILEDLSIGIYYGMQASNTRVWSKMLFVDGSNKTKIITSFAGTAINGNLKDDGIVNNVFFADANGNNLECALENSYGLASRTLLQADKPTAYHYTNNKLYYNLINGTAQSFESNNVICWRGKYRFYYE